MGSKPQSKPAADQTTEEQIADAATEHDAAAEAVAEQAVAEEPPAEPAQSLEDACAELGIVADSDGNVELELLTSLAGINVKARGESHSCDAAEAVRMVRAGFAKPTK
jgi:hypothetical protein